MTDAVLASAVVFLAFGGTVAWLALGARRAEPATGDRLVAELRLAQFAALLLALAAAVPVGFALGHGDVPGTGLVVAIAAGCFVVAALVTTWEPARALTALAAAWTAHAAAGLAHAAGLLPPEIVPGWYPPAGATYDVLVAALCYLPVLRR